MWVSHAATKSSPLLINVKLSYSSDKNVIKRRGNKKDFVEKPGSCTGDSPQEEDSLRINLNESRTDNLCSREHFKGEEI